MSAAQVMEPLESEITDTLVACLDCDRLYPKPHLQPGEKAICPRCGALLYRRKRGGLDLTLSLALTSLTLFILANLYPLMRMNVAGRIQEGSLLSGIKEMYAQGYWEIATLVFVVTILTPFCKIMFLFYVLAPIRLNRQLPGAAKVFRFIEILSPWAMTEVFMLSILVAIVKLVDLASIQPGVALYSFSALMLFVAAADASLDSDSIWEKLGKRP